VIEQKIDEKCRQIFRAYRKRRYSRNRQPNRTRMEETCTEKDIIRCYLYGMKIKDTIKYVEVNRGVLLSKSSVGRFYRDLFLNRIYPIKRRFIEG